MSKFTLFIQVQGHAGIIEATVAENITESALHTALANAGIPVSPELFVFIDEAEAPIGREDTCPVPGIKHGARVNVTRCRHIQTTVNFLERTVNRKFSPGTRVRRVKAWALDEFNLSHKDGAEHVLQICNSTERPSSDTSLQALVHDGNCSVCFDLVPEKRVEG